MMRWTTALIAMMAATNVMANPETDPEQDLFTLPVEAIHPDALPKPPEMQQSQQEQQTAMREQLARQGDAGPLLLDSSPDLLALLERSAAQTEQMLAKEEAALEQDQEGSDIYRQMQKQYAPQQSFKREPGGALMVPVAMGLMNRIATNYQIASVRTADETASIETNEGWVYITPTTPLPISIIISEEGVPESEVNVTIVPLEVPPTMIQLEIALTNDMVAKGHAFQQEREAHATLKAAVAAGKRKKDNPRHVNRIKDLLTAVARQKIPMGFEFVNGRHVKAPFDRPCTVPIYQITGQRLSSSREHIDVVLIHNNSNRPYQVREEMCLSKDALAVGIINKSLLMPGEETEIYIVRDKMKMALELQTPERPRLTLSSAEG